MALFDFSVHCYYIAISYRFSDNRTCMGHVPTRDFQSSFIFVTITKLRIQYTFLIK